MLNTHSQILPINANNMGENFCSKIFNIMTLDTHKSIGFSHLEARKQDSGVGNQFVDVTCSFVGVTCSFDPITFRFVIPK